MARKNLTVIRIRKTANLWDNRPRVRAVSTRLPYRGPRGPITKWAGVRHHISDKAPRGRITLQANALRVI